MQQFPKSVQRYYGSVEDESEGNTDTSATSPLLARRSGLSLRVGVLYCPCMIIGEEPLIG
jgi:hypothetical protein